MKNETTNTETLPPMVDAVDLLQMMDAVKVSNLKDLKNTWNESDFAEDRGAFISLDPKCRDYGIEFNRINTPNKFGGWIHHLTKKGWITSDHLHALTEILIRRGVKFDMHA